MRRGRVWLLCGVGALGCRTGAAPLERPVDKGQALDTGASDGPISQDTAEGPSADTESGEAEDTGPVVSEPAWCLDWESGTLDDAGYSGTQVELDDGAIVLVAVEGQEYSALLGEEQLDYVDDHALVLRSSHQGAVKSVARMQTPLFVVGHEQLWWWQLSEVREEGIAMKAELVTAYGQVLAQMEVPIETGGFIPALQESHDPIDGFPEIEHGEATLGTMVRQGVDLLEFTGQEVALRFSQHTEVEDNGFFTLIDQICVGRLEGDLLSWDAD